MWLVQVLLLLMDWNARIIVLQRNLTKETEVVRISSFLFRIRFCMLFHNLDARIQGYKDTKVIIILLITQ